MTHRDLEHLHAFEIIFMVFALAFALDEYTASMEHGWKSEYYNVKHFIEAHLILVYIANVRASNLLLMIVLKLDCARCGMSSILSSSQLHWFTSLAACGA